MERKILVVDDEPSMRSFLCESLVQMDQGYTVDAASDGIEALSKINHEQYDLVVTDLMMPRLNGIDLLREMRSHTTDCNVILMTAYGTIDNAVEAMKLGAVDYITKPFTVESIEDAIERALPQQRDVFSADTVSTETHGATPPKFDEIVGASPQMQETFELLKVVAPSRATVLISGESGTGKELVARAVHYNSNRRDGPFVKVNCAAMPEHLVESELFGHEKGAFTGAIRQHKGKFEMADGGTLLLDEISEMALSLQAKLLRVLQEREIERIGGSSPIHVDTRIVATTNRNLLEEIKEGRFREDLYYRLNVVPIQLPPLRERRSDIPFIITHFTDMYNRENGKQIVGVSEEAMRRLQQYNWPGNVREIENRIERAVIICMGDTILPEHLFFDQPADGTDRPTMVEETGFSTDSSSPMTMKESEKALILKTLQQYNGNRMKTAETLQISVRTLRNKLNEYRESGDFRE